MDIAKIRKKAREQQAGKRLEDQPALQDAELKASTEAAAPAEPQEQIIPEEVPPPVPEVKKDAAAAPEPGGNNTQAEDEGQIELLTFSLGREEYAFRVAEVEEIIRLQKMTKVPTLPDYVIGITSLRGKIIPVLDLKARLNLRDAAEAPEYGTEDNPEGRRESKILIIEGPKGFIGAAIDRVLGVVRLPRDRVLDPPAHLTEAELKYIRGIVILEKRFISVLRAEDTMNIETG